jgi:hypothetical protein
VERRVTFDRAVWTKPLASAADAAPQLCPFNRTDHGCASVPPSGGAPSAAMMTRTGAGDGGVVGVDADRWADLRRTRVRARHQSAWRTDTCCYDVS